MSLTRAFSRSGTNKNGRDTTPPTSPKRAFSKRQNTSADHMDKPVISKLKISAPVELISTTNMISYTSPSLRSSLGGSANVNGGISGHKSSGSVSHNKKPSISNLKSKDNITLRTEQNIRMSIQKAHYYPPSPASSGGSLGGLSPEVGSGMDDILTPPTTPPPNHLTEYFPKRDSRTNSSSSSQHRSSSTSGTRKSSNSTSSFAMDQRRQISRIKSVSSLNSSSSGSSNRYSREKEMEPLPDLPAEFEPVVKRVNTFGSGNGNVPAPNLRTHKSTISSSSVSSLTQPSAANSPALSSTATSPIVSIPARSSARMSRSASNPTLRNSAKAHRHHSGKTSANPFAHELAQVSELAEDMGLDLDEEYMVRKGLRKFSAEDYIDLISDVMFSKPPKKVEQVEEKLKPVVPLRKKPSLLRREEEKSVQASPMLIAGQADGGWI